MIHKFIKAIIVLTILFLISCGGESQSELKKEEGPKTIEFNLTANDQMQFNMKSMVAQEGDLIKINFENIGKMSKATMGHNFIIVKPGVDLAAFATKAISAKETEYIPADEITNIIVSSKLLGPGEKTLIEFTAPAKGIYKFVCSFPGHYLSMQGNLIVR